jgi:hypothetical protein
MVPKGEYPLEGAANRRTVQASPLSSAQRIDPSLKVKQDRPLSQSALCSQGEQAPWCSSSEELQPDIARADVRIRTVDRAAKFLPVKIMILLLSEYAVSCGVVEEASFHSRHSQGSDI